MGKLSIYKVKDSIGEWESPLTGVTFRFRLVGLAEFIRSNKDSIPKPLYSVALRQLALRGRNAADLTEEDMEQLIDAEAITEHILCACVVEPRLIPADSDEEPDWDTTMPVKQLGNAEAQALFSEITGYDEALFRASREQEGDVEPVSDGEAVEDEAVADTGD